jgi:alkaline phosphatase D
MYDLSRRDFLATLSAFGVVTTASAGGSTPDRNGEQRAVFQHGVASGDPLQHRVIIWTRLTPRRIEDVLDGRWIVATDPRLRHRCGGGRFITDVTSDFTVKIDVDGLSPDTTYYYQFITRGARSPIGRTRTMPTGNTQAARFAFVSCSNYPYGYFNAYARIAERNDLNFVLHLGDYIYEYELGVYVNPLLAGIRDVVPTNEIVALTDYRLRHALYRTDTDLQEVHRQHPFICVWDDHESTNDSYKDGAENHNPELGEGDWTRVSGSRYALTTSGCRFAHAHATMRASFGDSASAISPIC